MEHVRTRPRGTRRALIAAASLVCTAVALYPTVRTAHADSPALSVLYKTSSTAASADEVDPWLEVVNNTSSAVALSQVTLRYYFSADTTVPYTFACAWAVPGCSNLTGTVVAMADPTATADHYLQISFDASAGSLAAGASSGDLELRLYRSDWQNVNQANDYSFNAADTGYTPSQTVTAYVNGALVWGTEPSGATPTPTPTGSGSGGASPTPTPTPTATSTGAPPSGGTLFDDFDYTGPNDPDLSAHDWTIRTGSGGPGIANTWSQNAISFPSDPTAQGGKVMRLEATTDGTTTTQAEIDTTSEKFFQGTYAARVYFNDAPTTGQNGDHVNETFYTISPDNSLYSEMDNEYLPNGGWGAPGPTLYTTTWYSADAMNRQTHNVISSLQGWHTLEMTVENGTVTYYVDGQQYFSTTGIYYPREPMTIDFNEWFIDLAGASGSRTWDEKVNWVYFNNSGALSPGQVSTAVNGYYSAGTHFTDTVPNS
ncbi:cellulose binding domain-containing protein [Streptacidiphilus sp. P02-A3a]|uniref:cellulose binding domain-containing protein n=1 Tax=Streptacidiphilus sp. P02-A3a TaxID=2704468 RepID=UPI0015FA9EA5|nr:cellulose binding domain-containing protein [Streptacidiphilus sp. P02-A3a]QMU70468.1 family 16 glycosylhydrolase [Streptacidiphilus sp. P02-A3a]